jgi:exopolysaccharide biosynthesis polyprenyl glycosylphosphotransferase
VSTNLDVVVLLGSILITEAMLLVAMAVRKTLPFGQPLLPDSAIIPPMLYLIVAVIWFVVLMAFGAPKLVRSGRLLEGLWRLFAAVSLSGLTFAGALFLSFRLVSRMYFIYFVLLDLVALLAFYGVMRMLVRRETQRAPSTRVLIAGTGRTALHVAAALERQWHGLTPVVGLLSPQPSPEGTEIEGLPVLGSLDRAPAVIETHTISEIIIALPLDQHTQVVRLVRKLQSTPVHIRLVPDFLDFAVMRSSVDYLEGLPIVGLRVPALSEEARIAKRLFDMAVSAALLLLLWPLLLMIAWLIRRDSPGPAIYVAERVGENGRLFHMYKFRTMVADADRRWQEVAARRADGKLAFKQPDDPRITRVGQWLRRTSLDELPQLVNVLKGEMSLVGPRPELPAIVREEYEPWQWSRFTVPQGMTGWWQVNRRGYEHQHLCTADDLYYIQNYSLMLDFQILVRTVFVVIGGQGAY